jgi:hypothetical protein
MANGKKWYTALVNFTTKEILYAQEWDSKEDAAHQDFLNEVTASQYAAGLGENPAGTPTTKGDDWLAYGPDEKPFAFDEIIETA